MDFSKYLKEYPDKDGKFGSYGGAYLPEELVPAMGCTEPIAVAYAAALARDTLGCMPEKTELIVSGNIIKNVKSVVVPNTGGRKGLRTAVAAGLCFGIADKKLEVIADEL